MGHNRENFGALLKSITGNFKSIIASGLINFFIYSCSHYHIVVMNITKDYSVSPDTVSDDQLKPYSASEFMYGAAVLTSDELYPSQPNVLGSFTSTFFEGVTCIH